MAEMRLKGGHTTSDPRLDRVPQFDERSRDYPIRALVSEEEPLRSRGWYCPAWLNQGREGACFPAGTLVRMADGSHKPIEDVRTLDEVVTAEGGVGRVLQTMARFHADGLVRLRLRGHGHLRLTPDHPVLSERGYVAACDLSGEDRVALTRHLGATRDSLPAAEIAYEHRSPSHALRESVRHHDRHGGVTTSVVTEVPERLRLTESLGRLFGLYLAEGHTTPNRVVWTYGKHERETLVEETVSLVADQLGAPARVQNRPNETQNVVLYGKPWRLLFERLFGTGAAGKGVPGGLASGGPDFLRGMLDGWLAGDGHRRRTTRQGVTISHRLALDMFGIAQGLGLRPTLRPSQPLPSHGVKRRRTRWDLEIPVGGGENLQRQDDRAVWRKVTGLDFDEFAGFVFNLHVEGDESYVAEGVGVHNCVGFAWTHELAAFPVVVEGVDDDLARGVYKEAQTVDEWPGEEYSGTSVLAGAKTIETRGYMDEYRWAFGVDDALRAIGYQGPVVVGIPWYQSMFEPRPSGLLEVTPGGGGGHAILVRGVSLKARLPGEPGPMAVVRLRNSWGRGWGLDGDCYIRAEDFSALLEAEGDCCVPVVRREGQEPQPDDELLRQSGEQE
jgi:hypothetical protein